jgi:hypothetical protein
LVTLRSAAHSKSEKLFYFGFFRRVITERILAWHRPHKPFIQ